MNKKNSMQLPYGAVYFRKSNPPKEEWERDYAQAQKDGYNIFRHWFMWGAIEIAPGVYDWEDYDKQMELAEKYGIKTIIAEITTSIPEWVYTKYPEAIPENMYGQKAKSQMGVSCATGGFYEGLCLDTKIGRELTGKFLEELAKRYKGHPALQGYDVWNECNYSHDYCYCEDTKKAFRIWLKEKYKTLDALKKTWFRYSFTDWGDIQPPPKLGLYAECNDWLLFRKENAYRHMKWKIETIKKIDPECQITAHGTAQSLENMALGGSDEWMAAKDVELYGLTFVQTRKGNESYKQWSALDMTRSGARGKDFWHAESQGGHLWYQPQIIGRAREDGRITEPEDIRQWNFTTLAGGARGILCPRWRPLLDGPLFGAFGAYGMDGRPTPRSEMTARIAQWANAPEQKELLEAVPIQGEIGILIAPETQRGMFLLSQFGSENSYAETVTGAYRGFFDLGYQPDFVHIDDLDKYEKIYLPIPIMLNQSTAKKLADWVKEGGLLFSEGCPGYMNENCHVGTSQPNLGLDRVFGVKEQYVEFTQDLLKNEMFVKEGCNFYGGEYIQSYSLEGAREIIRGKDGRTLATENSYGNGKAFLIGTSPALGYSNHPDENQKEFFRWISEKMELIANVLCDNSKIRVRIHSDGKNFYLWLINEDRSAQSTKIKFDGICGCKGVEKIYWKGGALFTENRGFVANLEGRNAIVAKLII